MSQQPSFKEGVQNVFSELSMKEKILLIAQTVFAVFILFFVILGFCGILSNSLVNYISLSLLAALFIVSSLRAFPQKKMSATMYMIGTVLVLLILCFSLLH